MRKGKHRKKVAGKKSSRKRRRLIKRPVARRPRPAQTRFPSNPPANPEVVSVPQANHPTELPFSYGETKFVLLVRDPYWAYSYWDFSGETWSWAQQKLAQEASLKPVIQVHDLDAGRSYHLFVSLEAKNWYLHLGMPDHRYVCELGIGDGNHRFYLIARSNEVRTPRDRPSDVVDPQWNDRDFEEIYRLSGGGKPGPNSPGLSSGSR